MTSTLIPHANSSVLEAPDDEELNIGRYIEVLQAQKWLIALVTLVVFAGGFIYAFLERPVYEANLVIQVEDPESGGKGIFSEAGGLLDLKTPATSAEIEILRSRMIASQAAEAAGIFVTAMPRYIPYIGGWLARRSTGLSEPGFLGFKGYVSGQERIVASRFDVPPALEDKPFIVTAGESGSYMLSGPGLTGPLAGKVGTLLEGASAEGAIELLITDLKGNPGAEFNLRALPKLATVINLQNSLNVSERGSKGSGIVNVSRQDIDPYRLTRVLNVLGAQYVQQNVERKAAEAQKTLAFLDVQLPQFKRQLEASEEAYNSYRNRQGSVDIGAEATLALNQTVDRQTKLLEAQQRRRDLEARFTPNHPMVQTLDAQIAAWKNDLNEIQQRIKGMPAVHQEAVRLERDVRVNTALYQQLLNNALQLRLVKEGKVGNVRILDEAVPPLYPVKPNRKVIIAAALALGLFLGIVAAFLRNAFVERRIRDPHEVEFQSGLPVFSSIPVSSKQDAIAKRRLSGATGVRLLAIEHADDPTVESLRTLRTAMQFAMLESPNNRVLITGPTPGVGKSFVSANFAALMASAGRRTLLIDADLRRGHTHQYLGLQRHGGLSEVIAGSLTIQQTVHRQVEQNLDFLATGQLPPNPAELLVSESFKTTLERLSEQYDLVVIDTPPVLVAADTSAVAAHTGTVLLVARADLSTMGEIKESTRRLLMAGKAATGVLLNAMDLSRASRYGRLRYAQYNYQSLLTEEQS
jgi:tyrosine-protein kinase Etk/Wzc